ncbi:MAG TPA: hypothetical protein PLH57_07530 [Oligoflexia bacterium]|nr:hypothetical protein [Oligoflexia bacterium]
MNIPKDVIEGPWYAFALQDFSCWICDRVPTIPFPAIPMIDDEGQATTWAQWWGDLNQWWHVTICSPVSYWANCNIRTAANHESTSYNWPSF